MSKRFCFPLKVKSGVVTISLWIPVFMLFLSLPQCATARIISPPFDSTDTSISSVKLLYPQLVADFYGLKSSKLFWFSENENAQSLRWLLKSKIDSSRYIGLDKKKYHSGTIEKYIDTTFYLRDSINAIVADRIFTDAAISYCKDVYRGDDIDHYLLYDEISTAIEEQDNRVLLKGLSGIENKDELLTFFNSIEPEDNEYLIMKKELQSGIDSLTSLQKKQLSGSLQFFRWMHHFKFEKWIVVNIASATLRYYEGDSIKLRMKVVVGKPSTKTPRFAAHCNQVIFYPYWNVPSSIARNELLPEFKRNPRDVDALNMQVLDLKGNIVNHHKLNWKNYNKSYFPFRLRQSTGCDNSLGVVKFNLTSPFSVYLHDTNNKAAFLSGLRYFSHGCIRIEEPMELASYLLSGKVDKKFLEACLKDQTPVTFDLSRPVPVFVIYETAEVNLKNQIIYYKDIYKIL